MQGAWQLGFHLAGTLLCGSLSLYFAYRTLRRLFSAKARKRDEPLEIQARRSGSSACSCSSTLPTRGACA